MRRAAIISAASFVQPGPRVGMQFLAQILARHGFEIHYLSQPSSPLDSVSAARRGRFRRAWLSSRTSQVIEPNLIEHFVRAPFPVDKRCWLTPRQYGWYGRLLPRSLRDMRFDVCVHDMSTSFPLLEHLRFAKLILRLSDHPEGFGHAASSILLGRLVENLADGRYDQTWPVSASLLDYATKCCPKGTHHLLTNGVEVQPFLNIPHDPRPRTAVFVGSLDRWVDWQLLEQTALLLSDWRIDIYGTARDQPTRSAPNLVWHGPIGYAQVPQLLSRYAVGLIPFRGDDRLIDMMERPLKFYEYLAAGLGIASTDVGALRHGMGTWTRYGTTPATYAAAIRAAADDAGTRQAERIEYLRPFSWERIGARAIAYVDGAIA